ncbi:MAG TPA: squalene synthase HpnC [Pseudonocardiaceae bacterium]|nr:squalene synthase HpnC [Pseudonocardiaceae bacterium]
MCSVPERTWRFSVSAPWHACRDWTTRVVRRLLTASPHSETNTSHGTTPFAPLDQAGSENFSVAARLLPPVFRRHLLSIYVFARLVDDIGDEATGNRITLLDKVSRDLDHIYAGRTPSHGMLSSLAVTIRECDIPRAPFDALIAANRQDQFVHRYGSYAELVDYCELSANPVGRLVLHVFRRPTPDRIALSDKVCTALQILEHCQDVAEDLDKGRVYMPADDLERFGVSDADLKAPVASTAVRGMLAFQVQRARKLLTDGVPLVRSLDGWGRLAVSGYLAGGFATAKAIADAGYDVLPATPKPTKADTLRYWLLLLAGGNVS